MRAARRSLRLMPLVVVAAAALFALKAVGLFSAGNYLLTGPRPAQAEDRETAGKGDRRTVAPDGSPAAASARRSWMQEMFDFPEYTGTVAGKPEEKAAAPARPEPPADPKAAPDAKAAPVDPKGADPKGKAGGPATVDIDHPPPSAGERAVLESLNQRRQELDARTRELDVRESLLAATEKKLEARLAEIKETEARINAASQKKDEAETGRFKSLVSMYENMKAKDAAKVFDRLDMRILIELAGQINPRRMSDILAQMSPEVAERLTSEIATRAGAVEKGPPSADLPKIEGHPNGP